MTHQPDNLLEIRDQCDVWFWNSLIYRMSCFERHQMCFSLTWLSFGAEFIKAGLALKYYLNYLIHCVLGCETLSLRFLLNQSRTAVRHTVHLMFNVRKEWEKRMLSHAYKYPLTLHKRGLICISFTHCTTAKPEREMKLPFESFWWPTAQTSFIKVDLFHPFKPPTRTPTSPPQYKILLSCPQAPSRKEGASEQTCSLGCSTLKNRGIANALWQELCP